MLALSILLAAAATVIAAPIEERQGRYCAGTDTPCTNGVLILGARGAVPFYFGSEVNPNYDDLNGLEAIAQAVVADQGNGSYCRAIRYPAASENGFGSYYRSLDAGIDEGQRVIKEYVDRCGPSSRVVLLGYSEGAQLWTSVLVGDNIPASLFTPRVDAPPLEQRYRERVRGGATIASPSFLVGYPINNGTATTSGTIRKDPVLYSDFSNSFVDRVRNYCQAGDRFCASGTGFDADIIHANAVVNFRDEASRFLTQQITLA